MTTPVKPPSPFASKKFVAFMTSEITWKILIGAVLFRGKDTIPEKAFFLLLAIVIVAGFVEVGFIIGQGALDKFLGVARIIVGGSKGHGVEMKGLKIVAPPSEVPPPEETEDPPEPTG